MDNNKGSTPMPRYSSKHPLATENLSYFFDLLRSPGTMKQMTQNLNKSEGAKTNKSDSLVHARKFNDGNEIKLRNGRCSVCEARSIFDTNWFKFGFSVAASLVATIIVAAIIMVANNSMDTVPPRTPRVVITKTNEAPIKLVPRELAATEYFKGGAGPF